MRALGAGGGGDIGREKLTEDREAADADAGVACFCCNLLLVGVVGGWIECAMADCGREVPVTCLPTLEGIGFRAPVSTLADLIFDLRGIGGASPPRCDREGTPFLGPPGEGDLKVRSAMVVEALLPLLWNGWRTLPCGLPATEENEPLRIMPLVTSEPTGSGVVTRERSAAAAAAFERLLSAACLLRKARAAAEAAEGVALPTRFWFEVRMGCATKMNIQHGLRRGARPKMTEG